MDHARMRPLSVLSSALTHSAFTRRVPSSQTMDSVGSMYTCSKPLWVRHWNICRQRWQILWMLVLAMRLLILNTCCTILKAVVNPIYWKKQENGLQSGKGFLAMYLCALRFLGRGVTLSELHCFVLPLSMMWLSPKQINSGSHAQYWTTYALFFWDYLFPVMCMPLVNGVLFIQKNMS